MIKRRFVRFIPGARISRNGFPLIFLFLLIEFFDELHYGVQTAALPSIRDDFGLTYAQVGLLLGLPHAINVLIEPPLMLLGDSRLRKSLVVGGGLAISACLALITGIQTFPLLLLAFIISYPASGAFVTLSQATLMELNPGREPHMMARWTVAGSLGNLLGPLMLAAAFALSLGWRSIYGVLVILALALTFLAWSSRFPPRDGHNPSATLLDAMRKIPGNLQVALRNRALLRWEALLTVSDLLLDVFTGYIVLYFADVVGMGPTQTSLLLTGLMVVSLAADFLLIPLLERVQGRKLIRMTAILALFLYPAWLLVPWTWAKIVLLIGVRLSTVGWYAVLQGEAYAAAPGRSGAVAALGSLSGLIAGAMVWFVGWVANQAGLTAAMWLLLAAPLCLALFIPRANRE